MPVCGCEQLRPEATQLGNHLHACKSGCVLGRGHWWLAATHCLPTCLLSPSNAPQDRVRVEAEALVAEAAHCPQHVPAVYHYDARMCIIAMQVGWVGGLVGGWVGGWLVDG